MKVNELELVMKNKQKLDEEDINVLDSYNLDEQYRNGELHMSAPEMMNLFSFLIYLCDKHNLQ